MKQIKETTEEKMRKYEERKRNIMMVLEILGTGIALLVLYYVLVTVLIFFG